MRTIIQAEAEAERANHGVIASPAAPVPVQITPEQIVSMFSSRKAADRLNAEQALQEMGPAAVEALLEVVQQENRKLRKQKKTRLYCVWGGVGIMALAPLVFGLFTGRWHELGDWSSYFTMFSGIGGAAAAMGTVHKSAARVLTRIGDVRAVGPLTDMLNEQDKEIRTAAEDALTRLLPRITADNANLLSTEQVQALCWVMGKRLNPPLALSILQAMEHVGSADSLPTIRAIAGGGRGVAALEVVQIAAKNCLPAIEARAAREHDAQTLLRASAPVGEQSEVLLRPAGLSDTDNEQLLRPSNAEP